MQNIKTVVIPVILCGGDGTRLWPISRQDYPKQFLKLDGKDSFLQQTVKRARELSEKEIVILCNERHRFLVLDQLNEINESATIILEPARRDTAAAIAAAAFYIQSIYGDDSSMIVMSSDHYLKDNSKFINLVEHVVVNVSPEKLLLSIGISPDRPHTGYGYIQIEWDNTDGSNKQVFPIKKFHEKPSLDVALRYINSGDYLWNSGIFIFNVMAILHELKHYRLEIYDAVRQSFEFSVKDLGFIRLDKECFESCPSESVDYAVMENLQGGLVAILDTDWSDIGSWDLMSDYNEKDEENNVEIGNVYSTQTRNCFIASTKKLVVAHGVEDLIIIETPDTVLIQHKEHTQDTKKLVANLMEAGFDEVTKSHETHRPWGMYESLEFGPRFQVKKITVKPKQKLSLQMHHHRAEHWIVVAGTAKVTVGSKEQLLTENQSVYIPIAEVHCLENPGEIPLELIEVQSGSYLGEDDIVRFNDKYGRI